MNFIHRLTKVMMVGTDEDKKAMIRLIRYLKETKDKGLMYRISDEVKETLELTIDVMTSLLESQ